MEIGSGSGEHGVFFQKRFPGIIWHTSESNYFFDNLLKMQNDLWDIKNLEEVCDESEKNGFFQAEDGIRDCLLSRGLGDVYKRQLHVHRCHYRFPILNLFL